MFCAEIFRALGHRTTGIFRLKTTTHPIALGCQAHTQRKLN